MEVLQVKAQVLSSSAEGGLEPKEVSVRTSGTWRVSPGSTQHRIFSIVGGPAVLIVVNITLTRGEGGDIVFNGPATPSADVTNARPSMVLRTSGTSVDLMLRPGSTLDSEGTFELEV